MWLTRLSITRPVTILMLVLALVILGLQSRSRLPVDLYPIKDFPTIVISTVYVGTGPEEIETLVSKPIEDAISSSGGLKKLTSSSTEGISMVVMEFEIGTNIDTAASDIRSKLDALRNKLPKDADSPVLIKADLSAIPVISLSIASDRRTPLELRRIADDILKDRLSQLAGVAAVAVAGGDEREVRVEVDKNRLQAYGISISQVVSALQAENLNLPSGSIEEGLRTSAVRVMGEFTDPKQILNVRIPNTQGNSNLTINDVAVIKDTVVKPDSYTRVDTRSSVALSVQKQTDANTVKVVDKVREELFKLTNDPSILVEGKADTPQQEAKNGKKDVTKSTLLPSDIKVSVAMDQSTFIRDTLHDVYQSLLEGALLAVLIVFLFLHSMRGTFIIALAIPTSMIGAFLLMDVLGFSINMMTMMGLSLSVGILVDDSIVVLENIHRHLKMGESPKEAAINGRSEIGLAAMTITMVDVVVFVPIAFMGGIVGQFFRQFGIVVACATLLSLFISFTLTPMLASRWLKAHDAEEEEEARQATNPGLYRRFTNAWENFYGRFDTFYRGMLAWTLAHRAAVICLGLMVLFASFTVVLPKPDYLVLLKNLPLAAIALGFIALAWYAARFWGNAARIALSAPVMLLEVVGIVAICLNWQGSMANIILLGLLLALLAGSIYLVYLNSLLWTVVFIAGVTMAASITKINAPIIPVLISMCALAVMGTVLSLPDKRVYTVKSAMVGAAKPMWTLAVMLIAIVLLYPTKFGFEFMPASDQRQFSVSVEEEVGTSLGVTNDTVTMIEKVLTSEYPETKTMFTTVGATGASMFGAGGAGTDIANVSIELYDRDDAEKLKEMSVSPLSAQLIKWRILPSPLRSTDDVITSLNARFKQVPGAKITASNSGHSGPGGSPISIEVSGTEMARIQRVAKQVQDIVKNTEGTYGSELSWKEGRPEFQAKIDRDRAAQYGISVAQIASALRTSLEGDTSTKFRENGKEYDIRVFLPEGQRNIVSQLPSMVVGTGPSGQPVYLYEVVKLQAAGGPTKVERVNRQRAVTVTGQLLTGYQIGNIQQSIDKEIADKVDTTGVTINWAGQAEMMKESFDKMFSALMLSIILVIMLMSALFESVLAPLIIILSVPQAMAGALFAMSFTHKSLSIMSMIGMIMLVGLVTKNAILMVDYTNTLRKDHGMDRRKALLEAGPTRLRPILMTTLAMVFGMLPTAVALSKGSEMRQPMAIAVIGGLLLSLMLTLLMVPVFYEIMDDLGQKIGHAKEQLIQRLRM
ncbi:MAG: efflux RND transporter permease subunit [Armatimonadota bacterium]